MSEFTQAQLVRLISQMIQIGTIVEVQAKPLRYKVQFTSDLTTNWIPSDVSHAGAVKDFAPHQEGELVLVVKEFNTQGGVIVASLNQMSRDQPKDDINLFFREFPDGTWLEYDMLNSRFSAKFAGDVQVHITGNAMVHTDGNLSVTSGGTMDFTAGGNMSFAAPRIDWN
ncbi:phage baseplate assembly protein V [Vibrio sp. SCSIO 43169]|uniref:phage baseplate assembly protein V n=1 Tax=Vibrio sp. SCSIO 43169 TaxID=2822801 RepID=UPI0020441E0E|nr:phage baseplate assembly protein V [Vibrio sp. SCSIO 43169]MCM5507131.1 phage baseplate assembly protein V [Vibrio sp. SCSIO 43169]